MRKIIFIICLLILSCNANQPIPRDTLVIGIDKFPENLDPRFAADANSQKIAKLIYSGLLKLDSHLNYIPDLASYTVSNAKTYTFKLKENIFFHNGKPLTSKDVKTTYESMMTENSLSIYKSSLSIIQSIETPDKQTIIFKLKQPSSPFLTLMMLGIVPKDFSASNTQNKNTPPPGTGPYSLKSSNHLDLLELKSFKRYHNGSAKTPCLQFQVIEDATLRTLQLIKGRLDLIQNGIPYVLIEKLKEQKNLRFESATGVNFTYMAFNLTKPYLSDFKVRHAISHAISRSPIIQYKLAGLASKAHSLLSPSHWAHSDHLPSFKQNIAYAKKLLDEAGYKDPDGDGPKTRFNLVYKTSNVKERIEIAQLIAEDLAKVGIGVKVKPYEFGTFYRDIRQGAFDIYTLTWVGITDADIYHTAFHSDSIPPTGSNRSFYKNKNVDKWINAARLETDLEKRKELYHKIQEQVYIDFVYAPLWYEHNFVFYNQKVKGYQLTANASYEGLVRAYK